MKILQKSLRKWNQNIMKKLFLILGWLALCLSATFAQEIIVESRAGGKNFSSYSEPLGKWTDSVAKSLAEGCSPEEIGSRFVIVDAGPVQAEARFTPEIPKEGKYDIYVTWGRSGNAMNVKYVINNGTKEEAKYLDQSGWGGEVAANSYTWVHLGTFDLPAGNKAYVAVLATEVKGRPSTPNSGRVYVDAVKFVPADGSGVGPVSQTPVSSQPAVPAASTPAVISSAPFVTTSQSGAIPFAPIPAPPSLSATFSPAVAPSAGSSPFQPLQPATSPVGSSPFQPVQAPKSAVSTSPFQPDQPAKSAVSSSPFLPAQPTTSVASSSPFQPVAQPSTVSSTTSPFLSGDKPLSPLVSAPATGQVRWYTSYPEAIKTGVDTKKCIILFFRSASSKTSSTLEDEVLNDPAVRASLEQNYICCKLDINQNPQVCEYYSIFKAPVLVFLDARGYSRARIDIVITPPQLVQELEKFKQ